MHTSVLYRHKGGAPVDCFIVESARALKPADIVKLEYLLGGSGHSVRNVQPDLAGMLTVGPRLMFSTPESANGSAILGSIDVPVTRIERFEHRVLGTQTEEQLLAQGFDRMTQSVYATLPTTLTGARTAERFVRVPVMTEGVEALRRANTEFSIGLSVAQQEAYTAFFVQKGRDPTVEELFFLPAYNSDHSRHLKFNARIVIDGNVMPYTLFDLVRAPHRAEHGIATVAFSDNASAMHGLAPVPLFLPLEPGGPSPVCFVVDKTTGAIVRHTLNPTGKVETHNFPTSIAPFPGAATGVGGLLRDLYAIGIGAYPGVALWAGISVGNLNIKGHAIPGEIPELHDPTLATPLRILLEGAHGACDYANASGHPTILWNIDSFEQGMPWGDRVGNRKPILVVGGMGRVLSQHQKKAELKPGMLAIRYGGPTFNLGFGGATASSADQSANSAKQNDEAVQRGDPEMGCRTFRAINAAVAMLGRNPFKAIHDQGAAGVGSLGTELVDQLGATLDLGALNLGDPSIRRVEKLLGESQEGFGVVIAPEDLPVFQAICTRERVPLEVLGKVDDSGTIRFIDSTDDATLVDLTYAELRRAVGQLTIEDVTVARELPPLRIPQGLSVTEALRNVLRLPRVGSNRWVTTLGDSSVGGKVARSHTCGPMAVPVGRVGVTSDSYFTTTGAAMTVGQRPIMSLIDPRAGARMAYADMYLNMGAAAISGTQEICTQANWMWPASMKGEMARLYAAADALADIHNRTRTRITGGKDSLSMSVKIGGVTVASPGTLVLTGYAPVLNIRRGVTAALPSLKAGVAIGFVDLGKGLNRLGGSSLAQTLGQLGNECPDIDPELLRQSLEALQMLHMRRQVLAYHARSHGGLIATLVEMCVASGFGMQINLPQGVDPLPYLFAEEAGYVFAYAMEDEASITSTFKNLGVGMVRLGRGNTSVRRLSVRDARGSLVMGEQITTLREWWKSTSDALNAGQSATATACEEAKSHQAAKPVRYKRSFTPTAPAVFSQTATRPKAAVLREEGSNGHEEMWGALHLAGFSPWDVHMSDILEGRVSTLDQFQLLAYPGGFSFKDVFGAGRGQAAVVRFNRKVRRMFEAFYKRPDTLSLGVCNGNQFMQHLKVLPGSDRDEASRPYLGHNASGRFESRWSMLRIYESPSIFLQGMEGSVLGIHSAHGEGRYNFPNQDVLADIMRKKLLPLRFVGPQGISTESYPYNPNGSPLGIAGLCSADGRHLGMMPHPERAVLPWQWVYTPDNWKEDAASPWLRMFENACCWCLAHQ